MPRPLTSTAENSLGITEATNGMSLSMSCSCNAIVWVEITTRRGLPMGACEVGGSTSQPSSAGSVTAVVATAVGSAWSAVAASTAGTR